MSQLHKTISGIVGDTKEKLRVHLHAIGGTQTTAPDFATDELRNAWHHQCEVERWLNVDHENRERVRLAKEAEEERIRKDKEEQEAADAQAKIDSAAPTSQP